MPAAFGEMEQRSNVRHRNCSPQSSEQSGCCTELPLASVAQLVPTLASRPTKRAENGLSLMTHSAAKDRSERSFSYGVHSWGNAGPPLITTRSGRSVRGWWEIGFGPQATDAGPPPSEWLPRSRWKPSRARSSASPRSAAPPARSAATGGTASWLLPPIAQ